MGIKHVRQEDNYGCGIAVAAMVAGVTYKEARNICLNHPYLDHTPDLGMQPLQLSKLLRLLKVRFCRHMLAKFPHTCPYIVNVPSLNIVAAGHYIVVDFSNGCWEIYDPQKGNKGKKYYKSHLDKDKNGINVLSYYQVIEIKGKYGR